MHPIQPDLALRPFRVTTERMMAAEPHALFRAWTDQMDRWFAAPGTVLMDPRVNAPYFFETRYDAERHPHYGRFLRLEPDRIIEMTWLTAAGTKVRMYYREHRRRAWEVVVEPDSDTRRLVVITAYPAAR
jgi:uncharacterized protein YndB with AHSA1/START domain